MPLTVGVDTYATSAELTAYAAARGITITGTPDVLLLLAMDYLAALEDRWQGSRTLSMQPLAWPRTGVYVRGASIADDTVPADIVTAQIRLAIEADKMPLMPTIKAQQAGTLTSKSVGDVSLGYSEGTGNLAPVFTWANALLGPYYAIGGGMNFDVRRI